MPTIPFSGEPNQRGTGTGDRRHINVVYDLIADEIVKDFELHVVTRPCLSNHTQPLGASATGRGVFAWAKTGNIYSVFGTQLMSGTTTLASLASSTGRVWFTETPETSSTQIAICSDGLDSYHINASDVTVQIDENDDADYPTSNLGPVWFFSNYVLYAKTSGVFNSNLNAFTSFTAGDSISTGAKGDALEALWVMGDQAVALGKASIEFLFDNGNPSGSPLLAIDQNRKAFGIASKATLAWSGDTGMFVGEGSASGDGGRSVWLIQPGVLKEVSNDSINRFLKAEGTSISSASAWIERVRGNLIYVLNLSSSDRTFVYSITKGAWMGEWTNAAGTGRFNGAFATSLNGTIYVQDSTNGRVYTFSDTVFQDSGTGITVTLQTGRRNTTSLVRQTDKQANLVADTQAVNYLSLPGSSGNYASTPDTAALDITGDIEIRALVAPNDWTPSGSAAFVSKFTATANQRSYQFGLNTNGTLYVLTSTDGAGGGSLAGGTSTEAPAITNGEPLWVRFTLDVDDGSGNRVYKFYTSTDGVNWTQLGSTVTTAGTTSIFSSSAILEVGSDTVGTQLLLAGKVYRAQVYNSIGGTLVADFNASFMAAAATSYIDATGKTWTINTSGSPTAAITAEPDSPVSGKQVGLSAEILTSDNDYGSFTSRGTFDIARNEKRVQRLGTYKGGRAYRITAAYNRQFRAQALIVDTAEGMK
jgi:hypothetical protein